MAMVKGPLKLQMFFSGPVGGSEGFPSINSHLNCLAWFESYGVGAVGLPGAPPAPTCGHAGGQRGLQGPKGRWGCLLVLGVAKGGQGVPMVETLDNTPPPPPHPQKVVLALWELGEGVD